MCLEYNVDDTMDLIAEVLECYSAFFEGKHLDMLWKAIMSPWGVDILRNFDAESVQLARIIVAYAHILLNTKALYKEPDTAHHQQVMCESIFPKFDFFRALLTCDSCFT
jgi:hypothetical protein